MCTRVKSRGSDYLVLRIKLLVTTYVYATILRLKGTLTFLYNFVQERIENTNIDFTRHVEFAITESGV